MKLAYLSVLGASLAIAVITSACGEDGDTVIAMNLNSSNDVGVITTLNVSITQQGNSLMTTLTPPVETTEEGEEGAMMMVESIRNDWYERITVDGFSERLTVVTVSGTDSKGQSFEDSTEVEVVPNGAVAAFLEFALPPDPEVPEPNGAGGSGGSTPSEPAAGGAGGADPAAGGAGGAGGSG